MVLPLESVLKRIKEDRLLSELVVAKIIKELLPTVSAVDLGSFLNNTEIRRAITINIFSEAKFSQQDAEHTANCLFPFHSKIYAEKAWQDVGLVLQSCETAEISVGSEQWCFNPREGQCSAQGKNLIAKPYYTMPGQREGALIGRVGDQVFLVGAGAHTPNNTTGSLQFCINDDLEQKYGAGLLDNSGYISVTITVREK